MGARGPTLLDMPDCIVSRIESFLAWRKTLCNEMRLQGHLEAVMQVKLHHDMVITGSCDGTAKVWDLASGNLLHTLDKCTAYNAPRWLPIKMWSRDDPVTCISILNGFLLLGHWSGFVSVWDLGSGDSKFMLRTDSGGENDRQIEATSPVLSIAFCDGLVYAAAANGNIAKWEFHVAGNDIQSSRLAILGIEPPWNIPSVMKSKSIAIADGMVAMEYVGRLCSYMIEIGRLKYWGDKSENEEYERLGCVRCSGRVDHITFANGGKILISASKDRKVKVWCTETFTLLNCLVGHTEEGLCLAIHDGKVFSGSADNSILAWDILTGKFLYAMGSPSLHAAIISIDVQGNTLVSSHRDKSVRYWNIETSECWRTVWGAPTSCASIAIENDLFVVGIDAFVELWGLGTQGKSLQRCKGHAEPVEHVAIRNGLVISGGRDNLVHIWQPTSSHPLRKIPAPSGNVSYVDISANNEFVVTLDRRMIRIWTTKDGRSVCKLGASSISCIVASPTDNVFVSVSQNKVTILDLDSSPMDIHELSQTDSFRNPFPGLTDERDLKAVASISKTGDILALSRGGGAIAIEIFDLRKRTHLKTLRGHFRGVTAIALKDNDTMASASVDGSVNIWNLASGQYTHWLKLGFPVNSLAFHGDDIFVAAKWGRLFHLRPPKLKTYLCNTPWTMN